MKSNTEKRRPAAAGEATTGRGEARQPDPATSTRDVQRTDDDAFMLLTREMAALTAARWSAPRARILARRRGP